MESTFKHNCRCQFPRYGSDESSITPIHSRQRKLSDHSPSLKCRRDLPEAVQPGFKIFNDLQRQDIRLGQVVQIGEALVLQPEDIQTGLVTRDDLLIAVFAPAAFRVVGFVPAFAPLVAVLRIVVGDELLQVVEAQRLLLQCVMNIGAVIKKPDLLRPGLLAGGVVVEEQHIRFHAVSIENAGGQAQYGVQIRGFQQLLAHRLARTALEQDVVRHDDCRASRGFHHAADMLHEVELFV